LRFVAENHGITLAQMRRDIDRAMQEQRRMGREIPFQIKDDPSGRRDDGSAQ
jgi:hypothetical protein